MAESMQVLNLDSCGARWRGAIVALLLLAALLSPVALISPASAQTATLTCPAVEGVQCDGFVTDLAGVIDDDASLEQLAFDIQQTHGVQTAVVMVSGVPGGSSVQDFAVDIGNGWGVGDSENDGVVIVVDLDSRRTSVEGGSGISGSGDAIARTADNFFARGDFDGGVAAMLSALDFSLGGGAATNAGGETTTQPGTRTTQPVGDAPTGTSILPLLLFAGVGAAMFMGRSTTAQKGAKVQRVNRMKDRRAESVDNILGRLETGVRDLPDLRDYELSAPAVEGSLSFEDGLAAVKSVADRVPNTDDATMRAVWSRDLLDVIDGDRLARETEVPLELRVAGDERDVLDSAVQDAAKDALETDLKDDATFNAKLANLESLVSGVRPHRVAEARERFGTSVTDRLARTPVGTAVVSDRGERLLSAAPVLEADTLDGALVKLDQAYGVAKTKVDRLTIIHDALPEGQARPAVSAALTDLYDDPRRSVEVYEKIRQDLKAKGQQLSRDQLDTDAIAALLLMNHDELSVDEFIRLYAMHRNARLGPSLAVEYALSGLSTQEEIRRVKGYADAEGIPVAIVASLLRRREDGIEVYRMLEKDLVSHDVKGEARKTIAGVLAVSLEPAQAERRWLEARKALAALGLTGSYADIAAAFGASDGRGPREFALAYAAQRQALARSGIDDADRYAPELAHAGTHHQEDTWTGNPLPMGLRGFDPFTFFYMHWVITAAHSGGVGWEPIHRDPSWADDRDSWFGGYGGGGGFGSTGGLSGGSSWGGGGWSPGSFGGFGGGSGW